ncbi:MAG: putative glycoside hydrolase [Chloroflexota bacterium]|nr:putative glycoside hydrolase [Chloroflexota bacterium]
MPDANTVQSRQRTVTTILIAIPIVLLVLYLIPVKVGGQVTDARTAQPLADVAVDLGKKEIRTDAEGRFSTRTFRFRPVNASIELDRYQPWQGKSQFNLIPLLPASIVAAVQPNRLGGQIVDASSNEPVPGVILTAADQSATSDKAGQFELLNVPRENVILQAESDGFIPFQQAVDAGQLAANASMLTLQLLPDGLRGTVSDAATGQTLPGASVLFGDRTTESQDDGFYYVSHVSGSDLLQVILPGYLPASIAVESTAILAGEEPLDVALEPTVLSGKAVDGRTGEPLAETKLAIGGKTLIADEAGGFHFQGLHGNGLLLEASLAGYEPVRVAVDETSHLLDGQDLVVELLPKHLAGRVFNLVTDSPLAGATVIAGNNGADTDDDGRFILWGAEAPLEVVVSAEGFSDAESRFDDNQEIRVALKPRHAVITVEDLESGERLPGISLIGPRSQNTSDAQGVALLRLLDPGEVFTVTADGFSTAVIPYDGADQVQVQLYRDTIAGHAVDGKRGEGIIGATVYVYDGAQCQGAQCQGTEPAVMADTNADGSFLVEDAPPDAQVMVKAPGFDLYFPEALDQGECGAPYCLEAELQPFEARGFYIPFHYLYNRALIEERLDLVANSPVLNTVVVDMKSDLGEIAWEPRNEVARDIGVYDPNLMSAQEFLEKARERGIYTIARFVTFKDNALAEGRPEWGARKKDSPGVLWRDAEKLAWVDVYRDEVRQYEIDLAKELAELGYDEIQFDYFRFTGHPDHTQFDYVVESTTENRVEAITTFSSELMDALKPYGVFTSIDVFGSIILTGQEPFIGQNLAEMAAGLDYVSPMIYPQVWWPGTFPGCDEPVLCPYQVIYDSTERVRDTVALPTRIRPWLQGYPNNYRSSGPAAGYNYSVPEMMIQRKAADDAGADGWLFWSGGGNFPDQIFGPMPSLVDLQAQVAARQGR